MKPPIQLLQERDFGQKINTTFEFIGQNLKPLLTAILYIAGPAAIIAGIYGGLYQSNVLNLGPKLDSSSPFNGALDQVFTPTYFLLGLFSVVASLLASLTVYAYVLKYEDQGGPTPTITPTDIWDIVKANILSYSGYTLLLFILIIIGLLLLVIPGIYFAVIWSIIFMVMLRENVSFGTAITRCSYLVKDKWWSTFGLIVIMGIVQSIVGIVFQTPTFILSILKALKIYDGDSQILIVISGIIATLGATLTSCLINLAVVFQYYNLVEKKDGVGMLSAIDNIGKNNTVRGEE